MKLLRTIRLDPVRHLRVRPAPPSPASGRCPARSCSSTPIRQRSGASAGGLPQRLSRRPSLRLVDTGADRRGDRGRSRGTDRALATSVRAFRRAGHRGRARGGRGGGRFRGFALRSSGRYAGRRAPARPRNGAIREAFRTLAPARRTQADARLLVPRGRGRGRAGEAEDLVEAGGRAAAEASHARISGSPAAITCSTAMTAAGSSSPTSSSRPIWRGPS